MIIKHLVKIYVFNSLYFKNPVQIKCDLTSINHVKNK